MTNTLTAIESSRHKLHALLKVIAEMYAISEIEPVIIGWFQQPTPHVNDPPIGMFRLQYGARSWSCGGFSFVSPDADRAFPAYEKELEKLAVLLREAKWNLLALHLLVDVEPKQANEQLPNIEMFCLIDNMQCHFGVRDKKTGKDANFIVHANGLEPSNTIPNVWFDAHGFQHNPPVFLPSHMTDQPHLEKKVHLGQHVNWWYQTPLIPQKEAKEGLGKLLITLFERLSHLGKSVAIATSPHRFNDACGDDNWLAAIVDGCLWENGAYFSNSSMALARTPRELHEAVGLLQEVLALNVRGKFKEYLGNKPASPDTLILSADERGYLIAFSSSVNDGGPVYRVDPISGLPILLGVVPRLDWRFSYCGKIKTDENSSCSTEDHVVQFIMLDEWISLQVDEVQYHYSCDVTLLHG